MKVFGARVAPVWFVGVLVSVVALVLSGCGGEPMSVVSPSGSGGPAAAGVACKDGGVCKVGDMGPGGGTVFYAADSKQQWGQYLEAAPEGWSGGGADLAPWGCAGTDVPGANGTAIGGGAANTDAIIAACGTDGIAARAVRAYAGGGKTDWYLPTKDELNEVHGQRNRIAGLATEVRLVWSSSQHDQSGAAYQEFSTGDQGVASKSDAYLVRPVRASSPWAPPEPPAAPTSSGVGYGSVTLNWVAPADNGSAITGYEVQAETSTGGAFSNVHGCMGLGAVLTCTATGLSNGTGYFFRVRAKSASGAGGYSETGGPYTPGKIPDPPMPPASPVVGDGSVTLIWVAPVDNGSAIMGYEVQVGTSAGGVFSDAAGCAGLGAVLTCTATGLSNGTGYLFKVRAKNAFGAGWYSETGGPYKPGKPPEPPASPSSTGVDEGDGSVTLHWVAPVDNSYPITGYEVQYSTSAGGEYSDAQGCTGLGAVLKCTATGLSSNTPYFFKVRAKNALGAGGYSGAGGPNYPLGSCALGGICRTGDTGPGGGTVFYVADGKQSWGQYLEAAPKGWSGGGIDVVAPWGCAGTAISDAGGTGVGSGAANTAAISKGCADSGTAAKDAGGYRGGGKDDWYLPTKDELNELFKHRNQVAGLGVGDYWSSSQNDKYTSDFQNLKQGDQYVSGKGTGKSVRAVRAFSPMVPTP